MSRLPPLFPWVASFLYLAVLLAHLYYRWIGLCPEESPAETLALVGLLGALLAGEQYAGRLRLADRSRWTPIGLLAARVLLYEGVASLECAGFSKFLYLLVPFQAYFSLGRWAGYGLGLVYFGVLVTRFSILDPRWYEHDAYVSVLLIFVVGVAFAIVMARALQREEQSRARAEQLLGALEQTHARLRASAGQAVELAAAEERNRLARDIHDSLGHHLTAIGVQLEKALAFRERDPTQADRAILDAKQAATAALGDVRQSVSSLRMGGEAFSLRVALDDLAKRVEGGGLTVDVTVEGEESDIDHPRPVLMALFRAAQEGLTNVYRHAEGATRVTIVVRLADDGAELSVADDGPGFDPAALASLPARREGQFGLQGVRERVELLGGRMTVESAPGQGTRLLVWLPSAPSEASAVREHVT